MEIKNNTIDNTFFKEEKRDTKLNLTNKDINNLRKFLEKNYLRKNIIDCDKYYRQ